MDDYDNIFIVETRGSSHRVASTIVIIKDVIIEGVDTSN